MGARQRCAWGPGHGMLTTAWPPIDTTIAARNQHASLSLPSPTAAAAREAESALMEQLRVLAARLEREREDSTTRRAREEATRNEESTRRSQAEVRGISHMEGDWGEGRGRARSVRKAEEWERETILSRDLCFSVRCSLRLLTPVSLTGRLCLPSLPVHRTQAAAAAAAHRIAELEDRVHDLTRVQEVRLWGVAG